MYEALDSFLNVNTWTSTHWADKERFFQALDGIVRRKDFAPANVGVYIVRKYREQFGRECPDGFIDQYVEDASVVRRYLEANGQVQL